MKNLKTFLRKFLSLAACLWVYSATAQSSGQPVVKPAEAPAQLPEVLVTDQSQSVPVNSYVATNATSALKADVPLLETPQAVSVVPRSLMNDQGSVKLEDTLKNAAGVTIGGYYSDWDYYRIRGFDASFTASIDGLKGNNGDAEETFGLERVEVLKGPASSLYGQGSLGGMVNLVTKHPLPENFADVEMTIGSYDYYEPSIDAGWVFNTNKTVYMRLNALYRDQGSFVDYAGSRRVFVAPSLTWEIGDQTTLTFLTSYRQSWIDHSFPLPAAGTVLPSPYGEIPISRFLGEPGQSDYANISSGYAGYELKHQFDDIFSFYQNARAYWDNQHWDSMLYPWFMEPDGRTLERWRYEYKSQRNAQRVDTGVNADFSAGKVEQLVTLGVDYQRDSWHDSSRDSGTTYSPIDVFDPVYGGTLPDYGPWTATASDSWQTGLYLQDHLKFFERVTLTLGGRVDWAASSDQTADAITPRAGLTYEFIKGFAAYANYSQSFNPQWSYYDTAGNSLKPETGDNFEVGLKTDSQDGKWSGSVALYQLTRENVAIPGPGFLYYTAGGKQRSRGVEVEGAFRPLAGLEMTAAYTYTDAKTISDDPEDGIPSGTRLQGVPENAFNVWLKYTLQKTALKGLGFGIGGHYYTDQAGDQADSFSLPAYGIMDLAVYYERGRFHAQVNVNNVLDNRYFVGSYDSLYVLPGDPLTVRGSIGWKF